MSTVGWLIRPNVITRECQRCELVITFATVYMRSVSSDALRVEVSHVNEYGEMSLDRNYVALGVGVSETHARHLVWNAMVTGLDRVLSRTGCE